ncbi:MAG: glycosyltransferase family 39 protein, partial [Pseudomonadota bacterium]
MARTRFTDHSTRNALIVSLFAAVISLAGLFSMPPLDRDEARFAQATAQMLETGDFVNIRFQDEARNKKPAGIHWMQAASVATVSSVEAREIWAYRLPSMLGVVLAALFTYVAGARLYNET